MKIKLFLIIIWISLQSVIAQTFNSKEVKEQIKLVENNLAGLVKIEGHTGDNIFERMAFYKVKGLSMAVIQDYKIVWAKGYGWADEAEKRPVTTTTLFEPGSISKSFNALGILKLVQDKKLDLNMDINTYLKTWKFPYDSLSGNKKITLANLLSHTAGLTVHGFPGYNRNVKIPTLIQILDGSEPANTPAVRSQFEPGLKYQYSGGGTTISQLLLNDVTQMPYDKFIAENVFMPMEMNNSFFTQPPPDDKLSSVATGYRSNGSMVDDKFHVYPEQGAAGLWTTPTDVCKYIIETQLAFEGHSAKVLNHEMTKLRLTPYIDASAALGVFIEERGGVKYFQHGAGNEGFRGIYYGSLEGGNGVVVFVNSDNAAILNEVVNSVADVYKWKGFYQPLIKKEITVADSLLQKYAGIYVFENTMAFILKREDGYYLLSNGSDMKIHFSTQTEFFNTESVVLKQFIHDASGNVNGYARTRDGKELPPLMKVMNVDTLNGSDNFFNSIGWTLLENKKFNDAAVYLKRGMVLYPNSLIIEGNLAHCYLFTNNYETAIKIYRQHLNESISEGFTWKDMIIQDFEFFRSIAFDSRLMDKALADLKL